MKINKKKVVSTGLAVALTAAMVLGGGTYAYLQGTTKDVVNNFNTNKVLVELNETTGNDYNIIPGTTQEKDPKVTVDNTVDSYVYVEITDATEGLVSYAIADGWTKLDGYDNIYYREVAANAETKTFSVLAGDSVTYDAALGNSDMMEGDALKDGVALTFKARAIQSKPFENAVSAYLYIDADYVVSTPSELETAIQNAKDGDTIVLNQDMMLEKQVVIAKDVTIVGDKNMVICNQSILVEDGANVTFQNITFTSPTNAAKNASCVYASGLTSKIVFDGCSFIDSQWDAIQITPKAGAEIVINNCNFSLKNPVPAGNKSRFIHIEAEPNSNTDVKVTITNNHFGANTNMKDDMIGLYYINIDGIDFGGNNTFENKADEMDGSTGGIYICGNSVGRTITGKEAYYRFTGTSENH